MRDRHAVPHPRVRANQSFTVDGGTWGYPAAGPSPRVPGVPGELPPAAASVPSHRRRTRRGPKARMAAAATAAGLLGLGAYGVYATTLEVTGQAGTSLQAGSDLDVTPTEGCQTSAISVTETYTAGELDPVTGYPEPERTGFEVSNVLAGCTGKYLTLAVKLDGTYTEIGTWVVDGTSHAFTSNATGTTSGYSIRIASSGS